MPAGASREMGGKRGPDGDNGRCPCDGGAVFSSNGSSLEQEIRRLEAEKGFIEARIAQLRLQAEDEKSASTVTAARGDDARNKAAGEEQTEEGRAQMSGPPFPPASVCGLTPEMIHRYSRHLLLPSFGVEGTHSSPRPWPWSFSTPCVASALAINIRWAGHFLTGEEGCTVLSFGELHLKETVVSFWKLLAGGSMDVPEYYCSRVFLFTNISIPRPAMRDGTAVLYLVVQSRVIPDGGIVYGSEANVVKRFWLESI